MKRCLCFLVVLCVALHVETNATPYPVKLTDNFVLGNPEINSLSSLAFGPEGILFVGDSENAKVVAIDTQDPASSSEVEPFQIEQVDHKIASLLGTTADKILINDMAVNPLSKVIYFGVHMEDGTPVLIKTKGDTFDVVPLEKVSYSQIDLKNAVAVDATDRRGRSLRKWAISDLAYHDGKVMVSGLSNEEFSSTFRSIPFPFSEKQSYASLEIYHAAHGRYETYAPIKTFMPYVLHGKTHLVASYTCTPLVIFPMDEVKPSTHTKGMTVAELGNRNTPLDIISYKKGDKSFILLANTSRALMKIDPTKIEAYEDYLTEPVEENSGTAGVDFIALPYVNVLQMDKVSDSQIVLLQRMANGDLSLHMPNVRRL
ncbi:MAG: hypothetical protein AAF694_01595 [Bacteroidota bacterium]